MAESKPNQINAKAFITDTRAGLVLYEEHSNVFWRYALLEPPCQHCVDNLQEAICIHPPRNLTKGYWRPYTRREMENVMLTLVMASDPGNHLTMGKIDDTIKFASHFAKSKKEIRDTHLCFNDCLLDLRTFKTCAHTPQKVASVRVDCDYSDLENRKCPRFDLYIRQTCVHEDGSHSPEMEILLQEIAGYMLSPVAVMKAFFFYGKTKDGKSVFIQLIRSMLSEDVCHAATMGQLTGKNFELPALISKKANITDEDESMTDKDFGNMGLFKRLVSNELICVRPIYSEPFNARFYVKIMACMNKMPTIRGFDAAVKERLLMVPFHHFVEPKDRIFELAKIMVEEGELPGITNWALKGLKRLHGNSYVFSETEDSRSLLDELENASSSVMEFLKKHYVPDKDGKESCSVMYSLYCDWCKACGREEVSDNRFGREAGLFLGKSQTIYVGQKTTRGYKARRLLEANDAPEQGALENI